MRLKVVLKCGADYKIDGLEYVIIEIRHYSKIFFEKNQAQNCLEKKNLLTRFCFHVIISFSTRVKGKLLIKILLGSTSAQLCSSRITFCSSLLGLTHDQNHGISSSP